MSKPHKILATILVALSLILLSTFTNTQKDPSIPLIAIANYGPHSSLQETIDGLKAKLTQLGYVEDKTIRYEITDVNFETSLVIQMLNKLKSNKPHIIVAISTPVAQAAKNTITDIPVVYADVTDPVEAGLVSNDPNSNITGTSDKQDLSLMFKLAKQLLPSAKKVGVLYSTGEANDLSLVNMLVATSKELGLEVVAIPVEHTRDVVTRMKLFKDKVDFIYTGSSGAIQASLPAISSAAQAMQLPLFNFNGEEVISHIALASYGVSHKQVGANAAIIIDKLLKGEKIGSIKPAYPTEEDHKAFISRKKADQLGLKIPTDLTNVIIVD
ncbi:ABC transporter substrate binding protein [Candidatus Megaera venefica]|uniref:ABC transporter substrate binding protein n=1 Tax=Candidatus Megaera venefica TaxID=2055910 RepID=A0ABU5NAR5_9RICK|nr:ABC transporter substrate-binding protein [Candidatus Megaera venefica]MEA0970261.1 ABC transporter substrate binding protein [Candidatus Megaera venefica]